MDIEEIDDFFDNDEENVEYINGIRTYTVKQRKDYHNSLTEEEFFHRFRLSKNTVINHTLPQIMGLLEHDTYHYHEVDMQTQLLLTLRYYATGSFYITIGDFAGVHKTTAGRIIQRVTNSLLTLLPLYIKFPENEYEQRQIQRKFYSIQNFPRIIGSVDCTHVRISSPGGENAEVFRNRKGYFSLNVQAICDSENKILDIVARWPGSCHDSYIFGNSVIKARFENGEFGNAVLLGDSGYPLKKYLMTPLANPRTRAEELYNSSHISTRTVIERTFGIYKRRFPILSTGIRCKIPMAQKIIVATAILHNIAVISRTEDFILDEVNVNEEEENMHNQYDNVQLPNIVQQRYINYFETLL